MQKLDSFHFTYEFPHVVQRPHGGWDSKSILNLNNHRVCAPGSYIWVILRKNGQDIRET